MVNWKTKVSHNYKFFLRIFFLTHFDLWKNSKKFWWLDGVVVGWVDLLNLASSPGRDFVKVRAKFAEVGD